VAVADALTAGPPLRSPLGVAAAGLDALLGIGIVIIAATSGSTDPPGAATPRWVPLAAILLVPSVIGLVAALTGTRVLLVVAGVAALARAGSAFSGLTLPFLLPALLYLRAAMGAARRPPLDRQARLRLVLFVPLAVPLALLIVMTTGVLGLLLLVAAAGVASAIGRARRRPPEPTRIEALGGLVITVLLLGAPLALWWTSSTQCWVERQTPDGVVRLEADPPADGVFRLGPDVVAAGCESGVATTQGLALGGGFLVLALAGAVGIARRQP
jgi:hypothetical protein